MSSVSVFLALVLSTPSVAQAVPDDLVIERSVAPPSKGADASLSWESERELRFFVDDPLVLSCVLRVEIGAGKSTVSWMQPVEVVASQHLNVPLVLPESPPDEMLVVGVDYPLRITMTARNNEGELLGEAVADRRQVRWTGDAESPTRIKTAP